MTKYRVQDVDMGVGVHGKINIDKKYINLGTDQPRPRYHIAFLHEKLHSIFPIPIGEEQHKDIVVLATVLGPLIPKLKRIKGPVSIVENEYNYFITKPQNGYRKYSVDEVYDYIVRTYLYYLKMRYFDKVSDIVRLMKIDLNESINL